MHSMDPSRDEAKKILAHASRKETLPELTCRYRIWEQASEEDRPWLDLGLLNDQEIVVEYGYEDRKFQIKFPLKQLGDLANGFRINLTSPSADCVISHIGPSLGIDVKTREGHCRSFGISFLALREAMRALRQ